MSLLDANAWLFGKPKGWSNVSTCVVSYSSAIPYVIYYEVGRDMVTFLLILHGARRPPW